MIEAVAVAVVMLLIVIAGLLFIIRNILLGILRVLEEKGFYGWSLNDPFEYRLNQLKTLEAILDAIKKEKEIKP